MDRLPLSLRRVLVAGPIDNLDDLARRADRVVAEDRSPTSDPRFVGASDKLFVDKVDRLAESFNSFLQQCPSPQTVTLQTNSFAPRLMASINQDSNFQRLSFYVLDLAVLLTKGLVGIVFRRLLAHRWEIYVFTTQSLSAMLLTAYRLVLEGACCSPPRKH